MNIKKICKKYGIENYTINEDGSIDVNGNVDLVNMRLKELPLTFNKVTGYFNCYSNNLTSLKGSPRSVGWFFDCRDNKLTSLEFSPDYVGGTHQHYVGGWFSCEYNKLTDNYCDTEIDGLFFTNLEQDGLQYDYDNNIAINYNEWRKSRRRKLILDKIFS